MPKLKISKAAKRRVLLANKARLERSLAKVSGQLEQCLSCDADRLRRDLAKLDAQAERERARVVSRLGLRPEEAAELLQPSKASKKIPRSALARGAALEQREHGLGPALSAKIASDHLQTDPTFYGKKTSKKAAKKSGKKSAKRKSKKTEGSRSKMIANRREGFAEAMRKAREAKAKKAGKKTSKRKSKKGK